MDIVRICDALDWDYEKLIKQPKWFVDMLFLKRGADAEWAEKNPTARKLSRRR